MMKRNILAVVIPALLVAGAANAAEIYNKDSTNWILRESGWSALLLMMTATMATRLTLGFKGETQINDQLTGYGQWEYNFQGNNSEAPMLRR
jgi:outer membrane pore protein F